MLWMYYLIPIGVHLLFLPFWYLGNQTQNVSIAEMAVGAIIIPIYLIIVSAKLLNEVIISKCTILLLLMLLVAIAGIIVSYFNWGISTGNLLEPDSVTILILKYQMIASSVIITVGWIITCFVKSRMS
jgi:hypothetical protein